MSLGARQFEAAGIPTIVVGSARDIVEECGVARFLFVDFPLGNSAGKPYDTDQQRAIAELALDVLENAFVPRTTVQAPLVWDAEDDDGWRERFMHVGDDNRAALAASGAARRRQQDEARQTKKSAGDSTERQAG
ncbi:MAG: hypothetical protein ACR2QO_24675 [Acidimicrobiales bacterium]